MIITNYVQSVTHPINKNNLVFRSALKDLPSIILPRAALIVPPLVETAPWPWIAIVALAVDLDLVGSLQGHARHARANV